MTTRHPERFGLYNNHNIPEQQRLQEPAMVRHWNEVTLRELGYLLKPGIRFVDAGAGPNSSLSEALQSRGIKYIPFDIRPNHIEQRKKSDSSVGSNESYAHVANVNSPALPRDFADIYLMRFVLEHLPQNQWHNALVQAMKHTCGSVVVMMHDWSTLASTTHPEFIEVFRRQSSVFAQQTGIELYPRKKLATAVINTSKDGWKHDHVLQRLFTVSRPQGWYGEEFMIMAQVQATMAHDFLGDHELGTFFDKAATFFTVKAKKSNPIQFQPPSIVISILQRGL